MKSVKKNHTDEYKQKAVELSHAKGNVKQVSRELGISSCYYIIGEKNIVCIVKITSLVVVKLSNRSAKRNH